MDNEGWIDITLPVSEGLALWPGDTPFRLTRTDWGALRVGAATLSLHTGTHADAPFHFQEEGLRIGQIPVETYIGVCDVVDAAGRERLEADLLPPAPAPRVLLRTLAWTDHRVFPEKAPALTGAAIDRLAAAGVVLLGVDLPSVDLLDSQELPNHHALAAAGIHILESLDLRAAAPGRYELIALPLRLTDGDASPVRALLRPLRVTGQTGSRP